MKKLLPLAAVAAASSVLTAAAIALPALAGDDEPEAPRLELALGPGREKIEAFEKCMREHGFDLGDEVTVQITPEGVTVNGKEVDRDAFERAERECGPPFALPHVDPSQLPNLEELRERMEKLRDCTEVAMPPLRD